MYVGHYFHMIIIIDVEKSYDLVPLIQLTCQHLKVIVLNTGIFWLFRTCSASFDHLIGEKTRMYFAKSLSDSIMNSYSLLPNITIVIMQSTSMALQRILKVTKTSIFDKLTTMTSLGNPFAREWQIFCAHHIPTALNKIFNYPKTHLF